MRALAYMLFTFGAILTVGLVAPVSFILLADWFARLFLWLGVVDKLWFVVLTLGSTTVGCLTLCMLSVAAFVVLADKVDGV